MKPSRTETIEEETNLGEIDFPVLFKFCFKNAFNLEKVKESGYKNVWEYFCGKSKFNSSVYGWAGHKENGGIGLGISGNSIMLHIF